MTFELRLVVIALSAFAAAGLAGVLAVSVLCSRRPHTVAADRAASLLRLRLVPAIAAAAAMALTVSAFIVFEPRERQETTGLILQVLAGLAAIVLLSAAWRAWRLHQRTRRILKGWMATAEPIVLPDVDAPAFVITSAFPIVAVVGLRRQRVIIARSVVDGCTPDEIRAILAHEQNHIDRHDNLHRALFGVTPDLLAWLPLSNRMLDAWHDACEQAADDCASRLGDKGRLLLAQALVRVARLAPASPAVRDLPASALYRGEDLDRRVRRLLAPAAAAPPAPRSIWRQVSVMAMVMAASVSALEMIHDVVEAAVTFLP